MGVSSISKADPPRAGFFRYPPSLAPPQTPTPSLLGHPSPPHSVTPHPVSPPRPTPPLFRRLAGALQNRLASLDPTADAVPPLLWCRGWHRVSKGTCQTATSQFRIASDHTIESQSGGAVWPGGACSKSFWDLHALQSSLRGANPKTWQKSVVLGFIGFRAHSGGGESQNDLD